MKRIFIFILIIIILSTLFYGCSCNSTNVSKDNMKINETISESKENKAIENSKESTDNEEDNKAKASKENSIVNQNDNQKDSSKEEKDSKSQNEDDVIFGTEVNELPIMRAD